MSRSDSAFLVDIFTAAKLILEFIEGVDQGTFENSPLIQSAVIRQLEIAGEATKNLSTDFREKHPEIPWRNIAGMRDILIHQYPDVDVIEVWNVAQFSIPALIKQITMIISEVGEK